MTCSINLYDKHSIIVLLATFHCRGVEIVRKKMAKGPMVGSNKCVHHFSKIFV